MECKQTDARMEPARTWLPPLNTQTYIRDNLFRMLNRSNPFSGTLDRTGESRSIAQGQMQLALGLACPAHASGSTASIQTLAFPRTSAHGSPIAGDPQLRPHVPSIITQSQNEYHEPSPAGEVWGGCHRSPVCVCVCVSWHPRTRSILRA